MEAGLRLRERDRFCDPVLLLFVWKGFSNGTKQDRRQYHSIPEEIAGEHRFHALGVRFESEVAAIGLALFSRCGSAGSTSQVERTVSACHSEVVAATAQMRWSRLTIAPGIISFIYDQTGCVVNLKLDENVLLRTRKTTI